jgi:hypothetical protein
VRVWYDGREWHGRAVDLDVDVPPPAVFEGLRGEGAVRVDAPEPRRVHERVGVVAPGRSVSLRPALAAAARSRGCAAPQDDDIAAVRERLAGLSVPDVDAAAAREAVAAAGDDEDQLRERVAALQGAVNARRESGADVAAAEADLEAAVDDLLAAESERIAAEQRLAAVRERAREAREVRERRLRLEDRLGNLERAARTALATEIYDEFARAVAATPGGAEASVGEEPGSFEGDPVTAALGVYRVADVDAPVVVAADRFPDAAAAAGWLDAPVLRV